MITLASASADQFEEPELVDLKSLAESGLPVASAVVVPSAAEEEFYRLNNLAVLLEDLFTELDLADPDDDEVEELAPRAERLVGSHYLLDEFIDRFYELTGALPIQVRVRRPGENGVTVARGRESLLALKRSWGRDWSFERLWGRLSAGRPLLPAARPMLVQPAAGQRLTAALEREAEALVGGPVELYGDFDRGITMIRRAAAGQMRDPE